MFARWVNKLEFKLECADRSHYCCSGEVTLGALGEGAGGYWYRPASFFLRGDKVGQMRVFGVKLGLAEFFPLQASRREFSPFLQASQDADWVEGVLPREREWTGTLAKISSQVPWASTWGRGPGDPAVCSRGSEARRNRLLIHCPREWSRGAVREWGRQGDTLSVQSILGLFEILSTST